MAADHIKKGGSFLIEAVKPEEVFTPEDFTEEHKMLIKTAEDFTKKEVQPRIEQLEHKDYDLARRLMKQAGELGLLGADIDEAYGGSGMGLVASSLIGESSAGGGSFCVALSAHTGIGTMPIVFFGNKAQKRKYLPALADGTKVAAYALTEPSAGTDALSIQTKATLSPDGKHYILNGTKQFITNGGFADIIPTYAKVDGEHFTCFIVEKDFEGVSCGAEEKKMGIRGSSTTPILLEEARIPVENLLYEVGKGHHVAFNILDIGRFKLAAAAVGVGKLTLGESVRYAKERVQFGKPICDFGLIKHKLAEMAVRVYMSESMVYRTGGMVDGLLETIDHNAENAGVQSGKAISEYAIECSINKVYCSEMNAYVADEGVQIFGGYGFIEEYLVERVYRDCRIFRIFEGTNEINRLIIVDWLVRKTMKGELPLFQAIQSAQAALPTMQAVAEDSTGPLDYQSRLLERAKQIFLLSAGAAVGKYGQALKDEQEILAHLSDMVMDIFALESGLLRALKSIGRAGAAASQAKIDLAQLYANDALPRIADHAGQITAALETGAALKEQLEALDRISRIAPVNAIALRRAVADRIIEAGRYQC